MLWLKLINKRENLLAFILLLIGVFTRLVLLGDIPPGLNQDEASIGYDAWALLHYGVDRNGFHDSVHLVAWGSGQNALYAYLSMPFIWLFGLNAFSVRLLNALVGCLSLWVFYRLVERTVDRRTGILALLLLVISPWHIMASRWGLESNLFPPLILFGVYLLVLAMERHELLPLSLFLFALALYAYGTAYLFVPLFLLVLFPYLLSHKRIVLKSFLAGIVLFLLVALPIGLFVFINIYGWNSIQTPLLSIPRLPSHARFFDVSSLFSRRFVADSIVNLKTLLKLLFLTQNDGLIWNVIPGYGYMFLFSPPFFFLGIFCLMKQGLCLKRFRPTFFLLAWFWSAFFLGIFTAININRINVIFFPLIACIAFGLACLRERVRWLFVITLGAYVFSFVLFVFTYFLVYPGKVGPAFFESLDQALHYAVNVVPSDVPVYITDRINMPYIFVLFYQEIPPDVFYRSVIYDNPNAPFRRVRSFDRFFFGLQDTNFGGQIYVLHNSERAFFQDPRFSVQKFKYYSVAVRKRENLKISR
ncbi:MAG: ArnT family glycosyltransferase [Candidatus Caldatribacteriaceae bacterium]